MSRRYLAVLATVSVLVAAACSSGTDSAPPAASSVAPAGRAVCGETTAAGEVAVSIKDFSFEPATIAARVGQIIAFTNTGFEPHNATLLDGQCFTRTLRTGERDGLLFTTIGSYPFRCTIHAQMTGTITIAG
jgi:plastocyanin